MSHLWSPVATSLDHIGKVCLSSIHSDASVSPTYSSVWRFQLKAETPLEITGHKVMGTQECSLWSHMLHVVCKHAVSSSMQSHSSQRVVTVFH